MKRIFPAAVLSALVLTILPYTPSVAEECGLSCGVSPTSSWPAQHPELSAESALQDGWQAERDGEWAKAQYLYLSAARQSSSLAPIASFKALAAAVQAGHDPGQPLIERVQAGPSYAGLWLTMNQLAHQRGTLTPESLASGLRSNDRDAICGWLQTLNLQDSAMLDLFFGHCSLPDLSNWTSAHKPTPEARLTRSERMYGQVRFRAANAELQALDLPKMDLEFQCRAQFRTGRTVFRLRKRDDAEAAFRWVREHCADFPDWHVKALYAIGKRRFEKSDLTASESAFAEIIERYGSRSHADDAWFYLGRIYRERGDRKQELKALNTVLKSYREGDMLFELVWEAHEALYRSDDFKGFIAAVEALDLPAHDNRYYSQGRLEYFLAQAHLRVGHKPEAQAYFQKAWKAYPFSFYGYLSWVRLSQEGAKPAPITVSDTPPEWLSSASARLTTSARLLRLGLPELAAQATAELGNSPQDRWWTALSYHRAGQFHVSHNVVRRTIPGRPWHSTNETSLVATQLQWDLAWPNPFQSQVGAAIKAEGDQYGSAIVDAALPTAIMREESSFIEDVESYAGALGLMQLMPRTALAHDNDVNGAATPERLKTAEVNVRVGVDHIHWLAKRFDGHPALMVAAYNAGSGAVGKWLKRQPNDDIALFVEDIPYLQTRDYTKRVIGSYVAYQWLGGNHEELDTRVVNPAR